MSRVLITILLVFSLCRLSFADSEVPDSTRADTASTAEIAPADSLPAVDTSVTADTSSSIDTVLFVPPDVTIKTADITNPENLEEHLTQNPTAALFKSMFVPGWGQIGNHRYVKAGVIIGLETWFIASAVHYANQASDLKSKYNNESDPILRDSYYRQYQDKRNVRLKYTWFAGITVFVSMFDAYVDAQLSGAPDARGQDKVGVDIRPDIRGGASLAVTYNF